MNLRCYSVLCCLAQYLVSVFDSEESCIAEHVNIVCETLSCDSREHFVAHQINILCLTSLVCTSDSVCSKEVRLYCQRRSLLDALYDTEHLELILHSQTVAALDLGSSGTHGHDLADTYHRLLIEIVFRGIVQQVG